MVKISYAREYRELFKKLLLGKPDLQSTVDQCVLRFQKNPNDTRLDNHQLTKTLEGKWAFSITDDIRIVYEWIGKNTVRFLAIGGHPQVYPSSKPQPH
jgi:mRNA-degrading endonuclease YafQ of YafQ-DinJ toxin-antitoxin module